MTRRPEGARRGGAPRAWAHDAVSTLLLSERVYRTVAAEPTIGDHAAWVPPTAAVAVAGVATVGSADPLPARIAAGQ